MSYLNPLRLHFAGQFQADPSTVNNDVRHFNNAAFKPNYQKPGPGATNGWWNPDGTGAFRLVGCKVTSVSYQDGTTSTTDKVVGMQVASAASKAGGKLVDLDPQQQMASAIWGMIVRLTDGSTSGAADFFNGPFAVTSFTDMWNRAQSSQQSDITAGAVYQSVIGPVRWGDVTGSTFLQQLAAAAPDGMLSIKFNIDSYNMSPKSPNFTLGRCVGTIGPATPAEPRRFVLGRQLLPTPASMLNFMPAVLDTSAGRMYADFGNALPTAATSGPPAALPGPLQIGWLDADDQFTALDTVDFSAADWYETTAGVHAAPSGKEPLSAAQLQTLAANRLAVAVGGTVVLQENPGGVYVRADQFVFRLDPGDTANVTLYATQYGQLLPGAQISVAFDPNGLQPGGGQNPVPSPPPYAVPANSICFPAVVTTGANGQAALPICSANPGNPRGYIDGQVYGVRYLPQAAAAALGNPPASETATPNAPAPPPTDFAYNPWDFVSLLVWDAYEPPAEPKWYPDMQPIFQQYGNLYPFMDTLIDLTSYDTVAANAAAIAHVFGLSPDDPHYMPVTRDLSAAKQQTIIRWLTTPGPDGKPLQGTAPVAPAAKTAAAASLAATPPLDDPDPLGSKKLAMRTRGT